MPTCVISYVDMDGVRHSVEVDASSMYEGAALGISKFRKHGVEPAGLAKLEIEIRSSIVHTLTVKRLEDWLEMRGKTPREIVLKERLKELLT